MTISPVSYTGLELGYSYAFSVMLRDTRLIERQKNRGIHFRSLLTSVLQSVLVRGGTSASSASEVSRTHVSADSELDS